MGALLRRLSALLLRLLRPPLLFLVRLLGRLLLWVLVLWLLAKGVAWLI